MNKRRCFTVIVLTILMLTTFFIFVMHQRYKIPAIIVQRGAQSWLWNSRERFDETTSVNPLNESDAVTSAPSGVANASIITTTIATIITSKPTTKAPVKPPACPAGRPPVEAFQTINLTSETNVTVVSAYFNLGNFTKGSGNVFRPSLYRQWASVYQYIRNPFIFYTDDEEFEQMFLKMRENVSDITKVIRVNRSSLWAFDYLEQIRPIYASKGYPKYHPNTVVPEYTCAQHAKYACVEDAIMKNIYSTKYIAWLDLGYFRYIVGRKKSFVILPPKDFDDKKVAVNLVYPGMTMKTNPEVIFRQNIVWVGGGMFFGTREIVPTFIKEYKRAVERYLNRSLSNSDQQVLYSMNTEGERAHLNATVELQLYQWDFPGDCWFYLGYSCYREVQ